MSVSVCLTVFSDILIAILGAAVTPLWEQSLLSIANAVSVEVPFPMTVFFKRNHNTSKLQIS